MKTKTILHKILYVIAALLLSLFCCFESALSIKANAETTTATNSITAESDVLDDLSCFQSDDPSLGFNPSACPAIENDYSLEVLTIAEGANKELFVYVYQPCHDIAGLVASSISISTLPSNDENAVWHLYDLILLDNSGVFDKYQVSGFSVSSDTIRFYDIPRISRPYHSDIDGGSSSGGNITPVAVSNGQTVNEVPYEVGVLWEVKTVDGVVTYHTSAVETITITDKIVGTMRYLNGYGLVTKYCDSHFVAFSTDRKIDTLLEADLSYVWVTGVNYYSDGDSDMDEIEKGPETTEITVKSDNFASTNVITGLFGKTHEWSRIQSTADFVSGEENFDENIRFYDSKTKEDLLQMQWVLRFTETEYENSYTVLFSRQTDISEVTILRLNFVTDGIPYNLGVVDNSQTGSIVGGTDIDFMDEVNKMFAELADGIKEAFSGIGGIIMTVVIIVGGLLLLSCIPAVGSVFGLIFQAIFTVIGWILKVLFWVIAFPFSLIEKLFKRDKNDKKK